MSNPSLGWERLQSTFYRQRPLYDLEWTCLPYLHCICTTAVAFADGTTIEVYSINGEIVSTINVAQRIVAIEFDANENLVVCFSKAVRRYTDFAGTFEEFTVPEEIWDYKKGFLLTKGEQNLYTVGDTVQLYYTNNNSFSVKNKEQWAVGGGSPIILDTENVFKVCPELENLVSGSYSSIRVSPQGFYCCINNKQLKLRVFSGSKLLLEYTIQGVPDHFDWCGNDTVALAYQDEVVLIGPKGNYITFLEDEPVMCMHTEVDGLKVVTPNRVNFISKVSKVTSEIFKIGSTSSSAILLDCVDLLVEHSPKAVENLKIINLETAVSNCIDASLEEFDPRWQKKLLKAASFGKGSIEYDPSKFVHACDTLRVLNAIKHKFTLSYAQYTDIGLDGVIERLLKRQCYYDCIQILPFLQQYSKLQKVYVAWACAKVQSNADDETLFNDITSKLSRDLDIVGDIALQEGRMALSQRLIMAESSYKKKIPMLLKMEEHEKAMKMAIESMDPNLIIYVLLNIKPISLPIFYKYLLSSEFTDYQLLYDYFHQTDNKQALAHLIFKTIENDDIDTKKSKIGQCIELGMPLEKYIALCDFGNGSIIDILSQMITSGQNVERFLKKFEISEAKYYYTAIKVLIKDRKFEQLFELATKKKSPIGYEPFFKQLVSAGFKKEAARYVQFVTLSSKKIDMWLKVGDYRSATEIADNAALRRIYPMIPPNEHELRAQVSQRLLQ